MKPPKDKVCPGEKYQPTHDIMLAPLCAGDFRCPARDSRQFAMCRLVEKFGYVHLSAGDLLRAERKSGSEVPPSNSLHRCEQKSWTDFERSLFRCLAAPERQDEALVEFEMMKLLKSP